MRRVFIDYFLQLAKLTTSSALVRISGERHCFATFRRRPRSSTDHPPRAYFPFVLGSGGGLTFLNGDSKSFVGARNASTVTATEHTLWLLRIIAFALRCHQSNLQALQLYSSYLLVSYDTGQAMACLLLQIFQVLLQQASLLLEVGLHMWGQLQCHAHLLAFLCCLRTSHE